MPAVRPVSELKKFFNRLSNVFLHRQVIRKLLLQCLIFDSVFNPFRGIIAYFKIMNGVIRTGDKVKFVATGKEYEADEIGVLKLDMSPRKELGTGDVGYIISGIKTSREVKVGDTITHIASSVR